jgi:thiol-disulfide isomerase/thioredoxin
MSLFSGLRRTDPGELPVEGRLPGFDGATGWVNSEPLAGEDLRGKVVLVDFWTYTCINWLRTLAYVRAWAERYREHGLVVVGVHTPEFLFERDADNVRRAAAAMKIGYPIALDPDYAVWEAFANHYWPAVYVADVDGRIRHHQFGEGGYAECEQVVQRLLREGGRDRIPDDVVSVTPEGFEAQADWENLGTPETYLGSAQAQNFSSGVAPDALRANHWTLTGDWTTTSRAAVLNAADGRIAFRFHARDVHLVMGRSREGTAVPFRVFLDDRAPGAAHGLDVDEAGNGEITEQRLYQLIRQPGPITDRTLEITFLDAGVEAHVFTFG